jgi:hypothetical protein
MEYSMPDEFDPLNNIELFELDPKVKGLFAVLRREQERLHTDEDEQLESRKGCGRVNSMVDELGLFGDTVVFYGKVRLAPWLNDTEREDVLRDDLFLDSDVHRRYDERGEYWQLADHQLQFCPVDIDESEDRDMPISYVLTFRTPQKAQEAQEDVEVDESDGIMEDVIFSHGDLVVYPDDVDFLKPSVPSVEYIDKILQTEYPELYGQIIELLPEDHLYDDLGVGLSDTQRIERLAQLVIPCDIRMTAEFREWLGAYLFARLDTDRQVGYVFRNYATLEGLREDESWIACGGEKTSLTGDICALDIDESHQIFYIIAELSADERVGLELRRMSANTEITVAHTRPLVQRFGAVAMRGFDSQEDVAAWLRRARSASSEAARHATGIDEVKALFREIDMQTVEYQEKEYWNELSVADDIERLNESFRGHRQAILEFEGQAIMTPALAGFMPPLDRDIDSLEDIALGEPYVFTRELQIICFDPSRPQVSERNAFFDEAEGMSIRGRVAHFYGAWFPSKADATIKEFALAALLQDPMLVVNGDDDQLEPLDADMALVRIDSPATKGYRIIWKEGQRDE